MLQHHLKVAEDMMQDCVSSDDVERVGYEVCHLRGRADERYPLRYPIQFGSSTRNANRARRDVQARHARAHLREHHGIEAVTTSNIQQGLALERTEEPEAKLLIEASAENLDMRNHA